MMNIAKECMLETIFRKYIQPIGNRLVRMLGPIRPDIITGLSCVTGFACAYCIAHHYTIPAIGLLWCSGILDALDGTWARIFNMSSLQGMYADLISDRAVEGSIALGLAYAYPDLGWYTTLFLAGVLLHFSTFMLASFITPNTGEKSVHYEASTIERAEAFVGITTVILFPAYRIWLLATLSYAIIIVAIIRFIRMYRITL